MTRLIPCVDCGTIREVNYKGVVSPRCMPCGVEYAANERRAHHPGPWIVDGLCGQVGGDMWFLTTGDNAQPSKAVCGRCPVRGACRDWAIETDQLYGIWGGLTRTERIREAQRRDAA